MMFVSVTLGMIGGIVSSILRAIPHLLNRADFNYYSAIALVVSAIFLIVSMIVFERGRVNIQKEAKDRGARLSAYGDNLYELNDVEIKKSIRLENRLSIAVGLYTFVTFFYYLPAVAVVSHALVYYGESIISTLVLYRVIGFLTGILVLLISGVAVYSGSTKLERKQLFSLTLGALVIIGITQINVIVQRLYSLRVIPKNRTVFKTIAFIGNNFNYFCFVVMIVLAVVPIILISKNLKITQLYDNRAQKRKILYIMRKKRRISVFLIFMLVFNTLSITAVKSYAYREIPLSAPEDYTIEGDMIILPLEEYEDGLLHRYEYHSSGGMKMRFIVIKKAENSYGVCLDACEICGPSGYFMRGDDVVCKLCDVVMNKGTIGFAGGCNPIPLNHMIHDGKIKIQLKDLDEVEHIFK